MNLDLEDRLRCISDDVKLFSEKSDQNIKVIVVTKSQDVESIRPIINLGFNSFGENYLQEARVKIEQLKNYNLEWHFIGKIQSNKIKEIVKIFDWIQTVSSKKHLLAIDKFSSEIQKKMNVCIQINIDEENTKSGILISELDNLMFLSKSLSYTNIRGIMAVPSKVNALKEEKKSYRILSEKFRQLCESYNSVDTLSLGMSNDYKIALEHNSNMIRIGTLIFGKRNK